MERPWDTVGRAGAKAWQPGRAGDSGGMRGRRGPCGRWQGLGRGSPRTDPSSWEDEGAQVLGVVSAQPRAGATMKTRSSGTPKTEGQTDR